MLPSRRSLALRRRSPYGCVNVPYSSQLARVTYQISMRVRGMPHCDDVGCDIVNGRCQRTIHAEINALSQAARKNGGVDGATAYLTHFPCGGCFKALVNAGIVRVVYGEIRYVDALVISTAAALKIPLVGPAFEEIGHKSETPAPGLAERGFRTEQGATSEVSPTSGRG